MVYTRSRRLPLADATNEQQRVNSEADAESSEDDDDSIVGKLQALGKSQSVLETSSDESSVEDAIIEERRPTQRRVSFLLNSTIDEEASYDGETTSPNTRFDPLLEDTDERDDHGHSHNDHDPCVSNEKKGTIV